MARLADTIEEFLKDMLLENKESILQIQRNELADKFQCAPSQINYVLTTRFTYEKGYIIESRRGGGGCILIKKIKLDNSNKRKVLIEDRIGDTITYHNAIALLESLYESDIITEREFSIVKVVLNERTLVNVNDKNRLRANILKSIINTII